MYRQNNEEYIRKILGLTSVNKNKEDKVSREQFRNVEIEKYYPEIYKIIYPMVKQSCKKQGQKITNQLINQIVNEIYYAIEVDMHEKILKEIEEKNENIILKKSENFTLKDLIKILIIREFC